MQIVFTGHDVSSGHQAVEAAGHHEQRHVVVDIEADRGGECDGREEAHGVRERVLEEHALS
ncbi:MAG: hypothetical protein L0Y57_00915, partial [Beijerinckiaceae bacterium]|nr:hypothetical protein [Beijerinckiaceae bacterium]